MGGVERSESVVGSEPEATVDVRAVLFDMDGTLVDSTEVVELLWARFADRYGVDPAALLRYAHGRQTGDTVARFLPSGHDVDAVTAAFEEVELVTTDGVKEIPGARRLLDELAGARVAVVTSAPRALAEVRLTAAGVGIPEVLVSSEDVTKGKPDPEGYLTAASRLGVAATDCLVIEDAEAGIRAGLASGARVLVVGSHSSATADPLPHVADLGQVVAALVDGGIRLRWPGV